MRRSFFYSILSKVNRRLTICPTTTVCSKYYPPAYGLISVEGTKLDFHLETIFKNGMSNTSITPLNFKYGFYNDIS